MNRIVSQSVYTRKVHITVQMWGDVTFNPGPWRVGAHDGIEKEE